MRQVSNASLRSVSTPGKQETHLIVVLADQVAELHRHLARLAHGAQQGAPHGALLLCCRRLLTWIERIHLRVVPPRAAVVAERRLVERHGLGGARRRRHPQRRDALAERRRPGPVRPCWPYTVLYSSPPRGMRLDGGRAHSRAPSANACCSCSPSRRARVGEEDGGEPRPVCAAAHRRAGACRGYGWPRRAEADRSTASEASEEEGAVLAGGEGQGEGRLQRPARREGESEIARVAVKGELRKRERAASSDRRRPTNVGRPKRLGTLPPQPRAKLPSQPQLGSPVQAHNKPALSRDELSSHEAGTALEPSTHAPPGSFAQRTARGDVR